MTFSLFNELKRRNVFKVAVAYIMMSWLVMQVADIILNNFNAPAWVFRVLLLALLFGLSLAVFFAWTFELTPEGLKREFEVDRNHSITTQTGRKLDFLIIGALLLAVSYFSYDKFVLDKSRDAALVEATTQAVQEELTPGAEVFEPPVNSIAVLAFVNMSSDEEQEYFSDGLSEELLTLLSQVPGLQVISRTSAFSYKGKDLKVPQIARELRVAHVLEGSVRKSGNEVRITAQLVHAKSDMHLWSKTFDRPMENIFAIQDEIALEVVKQLKITLLGSAPLADATDPQGYSNFLQARHLRRQGSAESIEQAEALLRAVVEADPDYAAAWNELGVVYLGQVQRGFRPTFEGFQLARDMIAQSLAINPEYAPALDSMGWLSMIVDSDLAAAARYYEQALALDNHNIDIVGNAAVLLSSLGRSEVAIELHEFVASRDPVNPTVFSNLGYHYSSLGRFDEALEAYQTALTLSPDKNGVNYGIGIILLLQGEYEAALDRMLQEESVWGMVGLPMVLHALGRAEDSDQALAKLMEDHGKGWAYNIAYVLAYRNEADRAFEWLHNAVENQDGGLSEILFEQLFANIHEDSRWLPFLDRIGKSPTQMDTIEFSLSLPE